MAKNALSAFLFVERFMDAFNKDIIWSQFGASIDALEQAIEMCPNEVWGDPAQLPEAWHEPWYLTYHTLFWLEFYLHGSKEGFMPKEPYGLEEFDPAGVLPDRIYSKADMLAYLHHCRQKCKSTIESLTDQGARRVCKFGWGEMGFAELLLYNMRHVQHHTAQLNLILRSRIDNAPRWVIRAKAS